MRGRSEREEEGLSRALAHLVQDDWLTSGQMAEICCVSKKALRFYHEKGLVVPQLVDESSGYRYYRADQMLEVDRISRLQSVGFSLDDIKAIVEGTDRLDIARRYESLLEETERRIAQLTVARDTLRDYLVNRCSERTPLLNQVLLEWVPARKLLTFDLGDQAFELSETYTRPKLLRWYRILSELRHKFEADGLPSVLLNEVCTMVSRADLARRVLVVTKACVIVDDALAEQLSGCEVVPAGYYVSYRTDSFFDEDGRYRKAYAVAAMLDYISENEYVLRGDYVGIGSIDESLSKRAPRSDYLRLQIPVFLGV